MRPAPITSHLASISKNSYCGTQNHTLMLVQLVTLWKYFVKSFLFRTENISGRQEAPACGSDQFHAHFGAIRIHAASHPPAEEDGHGCDQGWHGPSEKDLMRVPADG